MCTSDHTFIPIPDHSFSFGNVFIKLYFLENLVEVIGPLFKIIDHYIPTDYLDIRHGSSNYQYIGIYRERRNIVRFS